MVPWQEQGELGVFARRRETVAVLEELCDELVRAVIVVIRVTQRLQPIADHILTHSHHFAHIHIDQMATNL